MSTIDLSGKIVFKVKLDKEIKKIVIHNDDINYNELLLMMQRIFSERIKPNDEFTIKYTDEENDLITLSNDSDVLLALQNSKILKLTIFLREDDEPKEEVNHSEIAKELHNIRLSIDRFLEKFERSLKLNLHKADEESHLTNDIKSVNLNGSSNNVKKDFHVEFDPLNKSNDQTVKLAQNITKNSRAETPDSIGSNELTISVKKNGSDIQQNAYANNIGSHIKLDSQTLQHPNQNLSQFSQDQTQHQQYGTNQFNSLKLQQPIQHHLQQQQQQQQQQQPIQHQPLTQLPPQPNPQQQLFQQAPNQQQYYQAPQNINPPSQHQQQPNFNAQTPHYPQPQPGLPPSNNLDPKQQQMMFQQQQPFYQQSGSSSIQQQPQAQPQPNINSPPAQMGPSSLNPYSKPPTSSIARPPSTNIYQQGYR